MCNQLTLARDNSALKDTSSSSNNKKAHTRSQSRCFVICNPVEYVYFNGKIAMCAACTFLEHDTSPSSAVYASLSDLWQSGDRIRASRMPPENGTIWNGSAVLFALDLLFEHEAACQRRVSSLNRTTARRSPYNEFHRDVYLLLFLFIAHKCDERKYKNGIARQRIDRDMCAVMQFCVLRLTMLKTRTKNEERKTKKITIYDDRSWDEFMCERETSLAGIKKTTTLRCITLWFKQVWPNDDHKHT